MAREQDMKQTRKKHGAAFMDWVSRAVLAWRLSNTLGAEFCVEALEEALSRYGRPEIFNTDQGSQFTSDDFTGTLQRHGVTISMDGKGRYMDNIFVERLWRSLKYEEVYLSAYASVAEAKAGIGSWLGFYNEERQHQSLGYRTPRQAYEAECPWICGRSASPTGCAFAHIPTGATANHRIDIDEEERSSAITIAPGAIGARYGNRPGYTLADGSGCLAIGVHLSKNDISAEIATSRSNP